MKVFKSLLLAILFATGLFSCTSSPKKATDKVSKYQPTWKSLSKHKAVSEWQSATVPYTADDVRFTMSKDKKTVYAFFLGKPKRGEKVEMRRLGMQRDCTPTPIKRVTLLGTNVEVKTEMTTETFYLTMPDVEMNDMATVFKFELE